MDELENAPMVMKTSVGSGAIQRKSLIAENILFNFGKSVETGASEIIKIADVQKQKRLEGSSNSSNLKNNYENH